MTFFDLATLSYATRFYIRSLIFNPLPSLTEGVEQNHEWQHTKIDQGYPPYFKETAHRMTMKAFPHRAIRHFGKIQRSRICQNYK